MKVLVVGGAGFVGSHMVKGLLRAGHQVVTLDNLATGYRDSLVGGELVYGDLADRPMLDALFQRHAFDGVMHFASLIQVGESVSRPDMYYRNNFCNTLNLLDAMVTHEVKRFIFSSTAAIFGEPDYEPIDEAHPARPINPYGKTEWMVEQALADYDQAYGLKSICLRCFNAAGADPEGELGERHDPETHLIPLALQAASGRRPEIAVFGRDYDTPDGTCIRDYVHVADLCQAHLLALDRLAAGGQSDAFNLGNGNGFSVQEVIDTARRVTGKEIAVKESPRRAGDSARLVANADRARTVLGWKPEFAELDVIVGHAWQWEKKLCGLEESKLGEGMQPQDSFFPPVGEAATGPLKISIIAPVFNNRDTIAEALDSVLVQNHPDIELIVIDGGSTDGTLEVLQRYADRLAVLVSEPNQGFYDALNKGLRHATGEVVGFLPSDGVLADDNVLTCIANGFIGEHIDAVYGDLVYVSWEHPEHDASLWKAGVYSEYGMRHGWMPPHLTFYARRSLYEQWGGFDTAYRIAADYDCILRFLKKGIQVVYVPQVLVKTRVSRENHRAFKHVLRKALEEYRALKSNGVGGLGVLLLKNFGNLPPLLKRVVGRVAKG